MIVGCCQLLTPHKMLLPLQGAGCGGNRNPQGGASLAVGLCALRGCPFRAPVLRPERTRQRHDKCFSPQTALSTTKLAIWPPNAVGVLKFRIAHICSKCGKKHRNDGFFVSFEACEGRILTHYVTFPRVGIWGAEHYMMSYFIVFLPFR